MSLLQKYVGLLKVHLYIWLS